MSAAEDFYRRVEADCPAFQARATARSLTRYYNAAFQPLGITAEQFSLMVGIAGSTKPTLVELATRAGVDATTLSRAVRTLEHSGLVHSGGGRGRAGKRLDLTHPGYTLMEEAMPIWERARSQLADALGDDMMKPAQSAMCGLSAAAQTAISGPLSNSSR